MNDSDKMRAEFEAYLKKKEINWLGKFKVFARQFFVAGYASGQKAERKAMQLKNWDGVRLGSEPEGER